MVVGLLSRVESATALAAQCGERSGSRGRAHVQQHVNSLTNSRCSSRDSSPARVQCQKRDSSCGMGSSGTLSRLSASHPGTLSLLDSCPGSPSHVALRPPVAPRSQQHSPILHSCTQAKAVAVAAQPFACSDSEEEELIEGPATLGSKDEDPLQALMPRNVVARQQAPATNILRSPPTTLMALIDASVNPRASLEEQQQVPVAPTNPFGLGTGLPLGQRQSTSGRAANSSDTKGWLGEKIEQAKRTRWLLTGASVVWLLLNLHQWQEADLTSHADLSRTVLDVLMNGPQMAQILRELTQVGLAVLLALVQGKLPSND